MTLNGVIAIILRYFTEFGSFVADYVNGVEARPVQSATKCTSKNIVLAMYHLWWYSQRLSRTSAILSLGVIYCGLL